MSLQILETLVHVTHLVVHGRHVPSYQRLNDVEPALRQAFPNLMARVHLALCDPALQRLPEESARHYYQRVANQVLATVSVKFPFVLRRRLG